MPRFNLDDYVDVQERIVRFWTEHPDGAIITRLMSPPDDFSQCRYEAAAFKQRDHQRPDATGYAFELAGAGGANQTSHEENCETSAIGRALANMGYATSRADRPSRQEMEKVERLSPELVARPVAGRAQPAEPAGPDMATEPQKRAIFALSAKKWGTNGQAAANRRLLMRALFQAESSNDLTKGQASGLIKYLGETSAEDIEGVIVEQAMANQDEDGVPV